MKLKFCPDFMLLEMSGLVPTPNKLPSIRQQVYSSLDIETSVPEKSERIRGRRPNKYVVAAGPDMVGLRKT